MEHNRWNNEHLLICEDCYKEHEDAMYEMANIDHYEESEV